MFKLVSLDGDEEPPEIIPEPAQMVQVLSSPGVISVFSEEEPDEPLVRWSLNPNFCKWRSSFLGKLIVLSLVEGRWFENVIGRHLFIEYDGRVMFWVAIPS